MLSRSQITGRKITSSDVARAAGVSQSAVSRCFRPGSSLSPALRSRIEEAARALGYVPNNVARALLTGSTGLVGVVLTALATGLALVPLALAGNKPGHEIEHPMAAVILGGLVTSTVLNLFLMPALYLAFGHGRTQPVGSEAGPAAI